MWMELLRNIALLPLIIPACWLVYHLLFDEDRPEVLAAIERNRSDSLDNFSDVTYK
jgi:hypothetical protein